MSVISIAEQQTVAELPLEGVRRLYDAGHYCQALECSARGYYTLAGILWAQRRFEEALLLYRWAACLEEHDEELARDYFNAARAQGQSEAGLTFLRNRFQRLGSGSVLPARTLFVALELREETKQAFAVLEEALALRPHDGELLLFAAQSFASYGETARAAELLAAAESRCRRTSWLRVAALQAMQRIDRPEALRLWRQVLEVEPLALDAHRETALLLAESEGRAAAVAHLRGACERFPHHVGLHELLIDWLRQEGPAAEEPAVRRLVEIHPAYAWARRELALVLANLGRLDEAFVELETAIALDPQGTTTHLVRARVYQTAGRRLEAREAYRQVILQAADCEMAISELVADSETVRERREVLTQVEQELSRQVIFGWPGPWNGRRISTSDWPHWIGPWR